MLARPYNSGFKTMFPNNNRQSRSLIYVCLEQIYNRLAVLIETILRHTQENSVNGV